MLQELKVENFAIIENLHIQFGKGLNILSGETGAGKSVLLKSLALLMGAKASSESVRTGCEYASIEGFFDLSQRLDILERLKKMGLETEENILVVRRQVGPADKSRVYLNNQMSTLSSLRDLVSPLIEIAGQSAPLIEMTGQHDNRLLLSKSYHLDLLDQYLGHWKLRQEYQNEYETLKKIQGQILDLKNQSQANAQRLDFLKFQEQEISSLDLSPGEEFEIENKIKAVKSSTRLQGFLELAETSLVTDDQSALKQIKTVLKRLREVDNLDPQLGTILEPLNSVANQLEDCVYELSQQGKKWDLDPQQLESLEQRLSQIRKLQKKFGNEEGALIKAMIQIQSEISAIENSDVQLEALSAQAINLEKKLEKKSQQLHQARVKGSANLTNNVNSELLDLNMKGVKFFVSVEEKTELGPTGVSDVEFQSQTSPKDPPRPLAKFASGGELSRILLSLKRVAGDASHPRTYLFDEVDAGVSGLTAEKVGKKLQSIALGQQVICVTHLPQVAACADRHFSILKSPKNGIVAMQVSRLDKNERIAEIARLISGEKITKTSLAHAENLLREASL